MIRVIELWDIVRYSNIIIYVGVVGKEEVGIIKSFVK